MNKYYNLYGNLMNIGDLLLNLEDVQLYLSGYQLSLYKMRTVCLLELSREMRRKEELTLRVTF